MNVFFGCSAELLQISIYYPCRNFNPEINMDVVKLENHRKSLCIPRKPNSLGTMRLHLF